MTTLELFEPRSLAEATSLAVANVLVGEGEAATDVGGSALVMPTGHLHAPIENVARSKVAPVSARPPLG